jgi:hypothetical protein
VRVTAATSSRRTSALWSAWSTYAGDTLAQIAAGFGISTGTAHAYTAAVIGLLADCAPGYCGPYAPTTSCSTAPWRSATGCRDGRADYSHKHRRHGVNVQVVTDPVGRLLWISPALPGRAHDLTAARTHPIIRICERQGIPVLADRAYLGAGPWVTTPVRPARTEPGVVDQSGRAPSMSQPTWPWTTPLAKSTEIGQVR